MGRQLILDTNMLVAMERGRTNRDLLDNYSVAIAAVTLAELRFGVELATDPDYAARRQQWLLSTLQVVEVLDYTARTAAVHARLMAYARRQGKPRGAHDLIIAAHAAETGRILVSADENAHFADLPGVSTSLPPSGAE